MSAYGVLLYILVYLTDNDTKVKSVKPLMVVYDFVFSRKSETVRHVAFA